MGFVIKLVIFDADETLWSVSEGYASTLVLPLRRVGDDLVVDAYGVRVRLFSGVRELLEELRRRGVIVSLVSANDEEPNKVRLLLEAFGIDRYFAFPQVNWRRKSENVRRVVELVRSRLGFEVSFDEVLFLDDSPFNIEDVRSRCPGVKTIQVGLDVRDVGEVLEKIDFYLCQP
nr:magnesium-dependent phosphatase-1 [Candidatus Freyrarchaeum guaymaensis]